MRHAASEISHPKPKAPSPIARVAETPADMPSTPSWIKAIGRHPGPDSTILWLAVVGPAQLPGQRSRPAALHRLLSFRPIAAPPTATTESIHDHGRPIETTPANVPPVPPARSPARPIAQQFSAATLPGTSLPCRRSNDKASVY